MFRIRFVLLLFVFALADSVAAQSAPERGTVLRTAILDGLRAGVADVRGLERDVLFRVHKLAVLDAFALASVTPISPVGETIYEFEKDLECDRQIIALLQFREAGWEVVERDVGPCDYIWRALFEQTPEYPGTLLSYWEDMPSAN
ncbi:MAG: hypothetical protein Rubg2KO_08900 [Rubricoccaceae bacterium]